jgi:tetratricopeptide (TPR) repeat protein
MSRAQTLSKTRAQVRKKPKSKERSRAEPFLAGNKLTAILGVLLAAVTITLYRPVFGYSFLVLDDTDYVTANSHVHGGLRWSTVKWAFTSTAAANWHPLTWLSHAFDYQLFALNAAGHHVDSVLIHAVNAVLLLLLLSWITKRRGPSLLVAALFALHPLNVESVAWVAERKNVLSTFFFLSAIIAYVWYVKKPDWRRYSLVAALFAAGLMAKPMVITLPFVLLLLDYWPLERIAFRSSPFAVRQDAGAETSGEKPAAKCELRLVLLEKIPLLFLSAASAWATLKAQRAGFAVRTLTQFPLAVRIENGIVAYGLYLWKTVWPAQLALYPHPAMALPAWQWILSALVLIGITALVIVFRSKRYLPVGWFWFLGTLVPVIGLVQVGQGAMADRYAYLPLIGVFVMLAFGLADLADIRGVRLAWRLIAAFCVLVALSCVTHRQMSYWDSDYDLWSHTLAVAENPFAHDAMGSVLLDPNLTITPSQENLETGQNRMDEARQHFERALELRRQMAQQNPAVYLPDIATTLNNLGNLDRLENQPEEARRHYEEALKIHYELGQQSLDPFPPDLAVTLNNLATLEEGTMQMDEARSHFEGALEIYRQMAQQNPDAYLPKVAETLNSLGFVAREQKQLAEARQYYEEALEIRQRLAQQDPDAYLPYLATTLNDLGILDATQDRPDDARRHYQEALESYRQLARRDPNTYLPYVAATLNNLALADESQHRIEESHALFLEDLSLFRKLYQQNPRKYAGDVARVEDSLAELEQKAPPR